MGATSSDPQPSKKNTPNNKTKRKQISQKTHNETNKEGLGPSEVALAATSPDP